MLFFNFEVFWDVRDYQNNFLCWLSLEMQEHQTTSAKLTQQIEQEGL